MIKTKAFLIHHRPFQEQGLLLDFLTLEFGMVRCVAKNARKSRTKIPHFTLLDISLVGKSELKSLRGFEVVKPNLNLKKEDKFLLLYVNELLYRLLHQYDECVRIFNKYQTLITSIVIVKNIAKYWQLRLFEEVLLSSLGYELSYEVKSNKYYIFKDNIGFVEDKDGYFLGDDLQKIKSSFNDCPNEKVLKQWRNLSRLRFKSLLGNEPLKTKELFR
ncbi:DNA recombination and repair protein RecO [hydrothermal vent metagenome]|uniref:DNA repair protein RecO n=1 Tax=hydrothermal vent metagenome TaxID=652676 RepID=A0A1W1CQP6_9ZZZZ